MPYLFLTILVTAIFTGCSPKKETALQIGDVEVSKQEFLEAYRDEGGSDPQEFLDQYISKKIILREAERIGLDRDPQFLADIQKYWEQGLLKLILTRKNTELFAHSVDDKEIEAYYLQYKEKFFPNKELQSMRPEIQTLLLREKQSAALNQWVEGLRKKTDLKVNYDLLEIPKPAQGDKP